MEMIQTGIPNLSNSNQEHFSSLYGIDCLHHFNSEGSSNLNNSSSINTSNDSIQMIHSGKKRRSNVTSETIEKRKQQNRTAQKAFRERKERHLRDVEGQLNFKQQQLQFLHDQNQFLKQNYKFLYEKYQNLLKRFEENESKLLLLSSSSSSSSSSSPLSSSSISFQKNSMIDCNSDSSNLNNLNDNSNNFSSNYYQSNSSDQSNNDSLDIYHEILKSLDNGNFSSLI